MILKCQNIDPSQIDKQNDDNQKEHIDMDEAEELG